MKRLSLVRKQFQARTRLMMFSLVALAVAACAVPFYITHASNPSSGTINPTLGATLTWRGTATGGASDNETTCVEGTNCDNFTLTISGSPADWSGKAVSVKLTSGPASDYDLVVHKDACNPGNPPNGQCKGAAVGSSGNGTGQPEEVVITPSDSGTGVYSVRAIYFSATPADQYQGSATVIASEATGGGDPTATPTPAPQLPESCTVPGTLVTTDPTGDATGAGVANPQFDITAVSIAEPTTAAGENKLSFVITVANLSSVPPNGAWRVRFKTPDGKENFVAAQSDQMSKVTYEYGDFSGAGGGITSKGSAEGSVDMANKRFVITVPYSSFGSLQAGQNLTNIFAQTQFLAGAVGTGIFTQADRAPNGTETKVYTLRGNAQCVTSSPTATPTPVPTPFVEPTPQPDAPRFAVYQSPQGLGDSAGEPTIGTNWDSGKALFIAGLQVLRVTFNDCFSPSQATWERTNQVVTNLNTLDPMLFTDNDTGNGAQRTNRTFASQLAAADGSSQFEYTDDDGQTYTQNPKGSGIGSGFDHQSIGGGPYAKNSDGTLKGAAVQEPGDPANSKFPGGIYPNAIYYASQNIGYANLARSDNGGRTFGPAIPMYDLTGCGGIHGHIKVSPDGTIYVPNKSCGGAQAVVVSEDNGLSFQIRKIPNSKSGRSDPSVGVGANNTIYFGYSNGDGRARIAVSRDRGKTWTDDQDAGKFYGVKSVVFPAVAAGDDDRASFFFIGSTKPGGTDDDAAGNAPNTANGYDGTWYGYISTTYDGGKTWVTVNATPKDPVQRGVICTNGTTCPSGTRNLLDFNDLTIDKEGRPVAALADGCITDECIKGTDKNNDGKLNRYDNDGSDKATIIRQSGGRTLHAAFDQTGARVPAAPLTTAFYNPDTRSVTVRWQQPDSDTPITAYKVFRTRGGQETLIATVGPNVFSYEDTSGTPDDRYRVAAVNAAGESPAGCGSVAVIVLQSPCALPGSLVINDNDGDAPPNKPTQPELDIKTIFIAEPVQSDSINRLIFTMNVGPSTTGQAPPNSQWFIIYNRLQPDTDFDRFYVAMKSDAAGAVRFDYGKFGVPLSAGAGANPNANMPVKLGDADPGSNYNATTGVITIIVSDSKLENIQPGQSLNGVNGRTFFNQPEQALKSQRTAADITGEGTYKVVGNLACATPTPTPSPSPSPSPTPDPSTVGLQYYALPSPVRLLDTREGRPACDTPATQLAAKSTRTETAVTPCTGIPAAAKAIVGNATVVSPEGSEYVTLYPSGAAQPTASNLNFVAGQTVPNSFTVGLGNDGAFNIYASSSTHFVVDVTGYYAPPGQGGLYYHPLPRPVRLLDTRGGEPACDTPNAPLAGDNTRTQPARTTCNGVTIPATAQSVVGNATVVSRSGGQGFITLYPSGANQPTVSNLNYVDGQTVPNSFTVGLGSDGAFNIYAVSTTDFIVDLSGYYSADPSPDVNGIAGMLYHPLASPVRLLDTRSGAPACDTPNAPLTGGNTRTQPTRTTCNGQNVPATAQAVVGNATVVSRSGGQGFITLYPSGANQPTVSNLNYVDGQIVPNSFTVRLGSDGAFNIYAVSTTDFVVDLSGYFAP